MTDRTETGQFKAGISGNPRGRPKGSKSEVTQLKTDIELALRQHVHPEKLKKVVEKVLNKAANGNMAAAKLIFDYFLSRPTEGDEKGDATPAIRVVVENITIAKQPQVLEAQVIEDNSQCLPAQMPTSRRLEQTQAAETS